MQLRPWLLLALAALAAPSPARAVLGNVDVTPAATLLVPYFEVDLDATGGTDAVVSVVNASATAVHTRVVLWTDAAVPVFGFNLYLTGYDMQSFSLRTILGGTLPATASDGQDPSDAISPQGPRSQDINFPACGGALPPAPLDAGALATLRAALTGHDVGGGQCAGLPHGDNVARGYLTIDTASACSNLLPHHAGYFVAGGTGVATNQNQLLGDFVLLGASGAVIAASPAVHIEASASSPITATAGNYTFYSRCVDFSAADNREPLATQWAAPYESGGGRLIVWRDPKAVPATFACADEHPAWFPLPAEGALGFDRQETATSLAAPTGHIPGQQGPASPFPAATNVAQIGSGALAALAPRGWLSLNLNATVTAAGSYPVDDPAASQAYVLAMSQPEAVPGSAPLATSVAAIPLDTATDANHHTPWDLPWPESPLPARGAAGPRPAATLLLPYFEVDLDDPNQASTTLTVTNVTPTAVLAHIVLWTDLGVPTYWGNLYLTGFDVGTIDLRLLFAAGLVETSASAGQDNTDKLSPKGMWSQDINFATCNGRLPEPRLNAEQIAHLRAAHTGQPSSLWGGLCAGAPLGDNVARGYVTVDLVNNCTDRVPGMVGYIGAGGSGDITLQNRIVGTFTFINRSAGLAYSGPATHLQVSATNPATSTPGRATFYGRFVAWTAADNREPLGNTWYARYLNPAGGARTNLFVWQDPGTPIEPFTCGSLPVNFPLANAQIDAFDEQEHVTTLTGALMPRVAARVDVGPGGLAVPYAAGFLALDFLAAEPNARQASVVAVHPVNSSAAAMGAFQIDNPAW